MARSLNEQYHACIDRQAALENSRIPSADSEYQDDVRTLLREFGELEERITSAMIFSRNEELDDVKTIHLKYLLVPYLVAEALRRINGPARAPALRRARQYHDRFVAKCRMMEVLREREIDALFDTNPRQRDALLQARQKEKEMEERLGALQLRRNRLGTLELEEGTEENDAWDDVEREFQIISVEKCLRSIPKENNFMEQELELLGMSEEAKEEALVEWEEGKREARENPRPPIVIPSKMEQEVDFRKQIMQDVIANTGRPHNAPTMTMDEYMELHPEEFTPAPQEPEPEPVDEDDVEGHDSHQVYKDRAWDDYVDEHPRGCGNRGGNVG